MTWRTRLANFAWCLLAVSVTLACGLLVIATLTTHDALTSAIVLAVTLFGVMACRKRRV